MNPRLGLTYRSSLRRSAHIPVKGAAGLGIHGIVHGSLAAGIAAAALMAVSRATAATPDAPPPALPARLLTVTPGADGVLDLRAGSTVLARIPIATPALRLGVPRAREWEIERHRIAEVRIAVRGRPVEEVWIGEIDHKGAHLIWNGILGSRDADDEAAIFVEVTPDGIFEYQTAAHVTRCDDEPVRLLPRAWDFGGMRFRPIVSTPPAPAVQRLTPRRGDPAMPSTRPIGGFHFTAASTTAAAGTDARGLAAPTALDDGDPRTAWMEGLGGDGRGEFLTARASAGHYRVRGLRIVPGDASTPAAFKARNRLKSLALTFGARPEHRFEVDFPEDPAAASGQSRVAYWIALPAPVESACVTLTIRGVYRGTEAGPPGGGGTTAISDVEVFTELDEAGGVDRLVADMAGGTDCATRIPLLVALNQAAVLPAAQTIIGASGVGRECLVDVLAHIDATLQSAVALDALAAALVGATPHEEKLIGATLKKAAKPPVGAVVALLASRAAAPDDRARAARILGELGERGDPGSAAALLAAAGAQTDPGEVRLAIVQALSRSPAVTVPVLVAAIDGARGTAGAGAARRQADLLSALAAIARRAAGDRPAAIQALRRSLAPGQPFEVQARAVLALGAIGDPAVAGDLAAVRDRSDDAVLRFLATRELGACCGPAASQALRAALADRDPRVRETAAEGIGQRRDIAMEAALIQAAKDEPWPFARRAQIEALSRTCGAPARDLLIRAMERDIDEVRRAALVGLVRCRDERARATLISTVKNRRASATLRELAAALLGERGDKGVARELAEILAALVNEAEADLAVEGVVVSAIRSLGQLGGPDAARATSHLAADPRHPYRHIAVDALGDICDGDIGAKTLAALRAGTERALAAAADSAERRCQARAPGAH